MFEFGFYEKEITPPLGCGIPGYFSIRRGCDVLDRPTPGIPLLCSDREGFRLTVHRNGTVEHPDGPDVLAAAAKWLSLGYAVPAFGAELI